MKRSLSRDFELDAHWGSTDGTLWHGTITVTASSARQAMQIALARRIIPDSVDARDLVCARTEYFADHYDVEHIGEEFDAVRLDELRNTMERLLIGHEVWVNTN